MAKLEATADFTLRFGVERPLTFGETKRLEDHIRSAIQFYMDEEGMDIDGANPIVDLANVQFHAGPISIGPKVGDDQGREGSDEA